mgnify:CR=1 FL=1
MLSHGGEKYLRIVHGDAFAVLHGAELSDWMGMPHINRYGSTMGAQPAQIAVAANTPAQQPVHLAVLLLTDRVAEGWPPTS